MGRWGHESGNACLYQTLRGKERSFPGAFREQPCRHSNFGLLASRTERINHCSSELPSPWPFVSAALGHESTAMLVTATHPPLLPCCALALVQCLQTFIYVHRHTYIYTYSSLFFLNHLRVGHVHHDPLYFSIKVMISSEHRYSLTDLQESYQIQKI